MGCDLYIKDLPREAQYTGFEVSQESVNVGYFRDCYNSSGLFSWLTDNTGMEFSWWQLTEEKKDDWFRDDEEEGMLLTVRGAKEFLNLLNIAESIMVKQHSYFKKNLEIKNGKPFYKEEKQTDEEAMKYYEWFGLLLQFLNTAIKRKSEVIWSV